MNTSKKRYENILARLYKIGWKRDQVLSILDNFLRYFAKEIIPLECVECSDMALFVNLFSFTEDSRREFFDLLRWRARFSLEKEIDGLVNWSDEDFGCRIPKFIAIYFNVLDNNLRNKEKELGHDRINAVNRIGTNGESPRGLNSELIDYVFNFYKTLQEELKQSFVFLY